MDSFKDKILKVHDSLFRVAISLTRDRDDACDLLQDTLVKLLVNEKKYTEQNNFKGWAIMIMRNLFLNNYRRLMRYQSETSFVAVDNVSLAFDDTPESDYNYKELSKIVAKLPEIYRKPFKLYLAGFTYNEISEKLGLPLGTVKSRIFAVRRKLGHILS